MTAATVFWLIAVIAFVVLEAVTTALVSVWFAVGGVAAYAALAFVTVRFFGRSVTTELLLFVLWAALELAVLNALMGAGMLFGGAFWLLAGVVALVTAANLVCYVLYFRLPPVPSFIDGAAPLAVVGVLSAVLAVVIARL